MALFVRQHIRTQPAGTRVRTIVSGKHRLLIAFPKGRRKKGSGKLLEVLHPRTENPALCRLAKKNPAELLVLGNPAELLVLGGNPRKENAAEDVYRGFQGREPAELLEYDETQRMPRKAAVLGDLVALGFGNETKGGQKLHGDQLAIRWNECSHISFAGDDVKLASNAARTQLYLVGGNQELTESALKTLGGAELGPVYFIVYDTRKAQDNFEGGQYTHEFAEDGGRRPTARYDAHAERILLRGGNYRIEDRGIVN